MTTYIRNTPHRREVLSLLSTGPATSPEIRKALGINSSGQACSMLKSMVLNGLIKASGSAPHTVYSLPSPDDPAQPMVDAKVYDGQGMMTEAREHALALAATGPITTSDIVRTRGIGLGAATNLLYGMVEVGLLVRQRKDRNQSVAYEYSLPAPSAQPAQPQMEKPVLKPSLPAAKPSIKPPSSKSLWEQIENVLSTTTRMSMADIVKAGVPNDGRLHRMLKEMYSAGKIARWLAGDHYVYTLANTLHPATAKLKDFVPPETFKKEYVAIPTVSPQLADLHEKLDAPAKAPVDEVSVIGENVLGEMAALRKELERTRKELSDARERLKMHNTYSITLPKLAGGASWEDFYVGDVAKIDYDAAVAIHNELQAQLEA